MSTVARINAEINLKDNLSRPLSDAGAKVKRFADRARDDLGRFSVGARRAWKEFGDELGKVSQKAQMAGLAMTAGLTAPILGFSKVAVDAAAKMESMRASMTAITGSSSAANAQLAELEAMAGRTATSYDLLVAASKGLIAGFDGDVKGANAVLERFSVLSNVLGVSRTDFDRLVINLTQIGGASRLTGDELREMASILPNLRTLLKDAFGTNRTEDLAKLGITGRQALEGIAKAIDARGFKANTETYNAQLQILSTEFFKLKVAAGEALLPIARTVVQYLTPAFKQLAEYVRKLTPEQKKAAVTLLAIAAAAGPVIGILGSIGNLISGMIGAWGALSKVFTALRTAISASGGALGIIRTALAVLTGPVGVVIAALTALYLAWRNNFAKIRDVVLPLVENIREMLSDVWTNVKSTFDSIWPVVVDAWNTVVEKTKPIIEYFSALLNAYWTKMADTVRIVFRLITDVINVSLAGWKLIFGGGWADLTNSMKASMLRMRGIALTIFTNIAQFIINAFRAMTGWASRIPGIGGLYDNLLDGAQARVDALRAEGEAADFLAGRYQAAADAERYFRENPASIVTGSKLGTLRGPIGSTGRKLGGIANPYAPVDPMSGSAGGAKIRIEKAKETEEEKLKNQIIAETVQLTRELAVERMKARNETLKDILAMQEFGKKYEEIQTDYRKAKIDAMAALEVFKKEQEERVRIAEEEKERLEAAIKARADLNRAVFESAIAFAKERDQLSFTTEEERARWEVTKGGYADANAFAKAFYVTQAQLLDQSRAAKQSAERWKELWAAIAAKHKEWIASQREDAESNYKDYVRDLTKELLRLRGAQDEIVRSELFEQFKGAGAGMPGLLGFLKVLGMVSKVMSDMKRNADLEKKFELIKKIARGIEEVFENSLDRLFENGFKNFFSSVIDGFRDLARQIAAEFLKMQLLKALLWGIGSLFGSSASADFRKGIPGLARGGSAFAGEPYIVGERGPELFVPNVNGSVIRRNETASLAGGGGPNIVVNLQVPNYSAFKRSEAQLAAQVFARAGRARAREGR